MLIIYIVLIVLIIFLIYGYLSHYHFVTGKYDIDIASYEGSLRIVVLSDLHCCVHGRENIKLIKRINEISPDLILIPGDMVTKRLSVSDERVKRVIRLIKALSNVCPVYYSPGNHEIRLLEPDKYVSELKAAGVVYLSNSSAELSDRKLVIYGLDLPLERYRDMTCLSKEEIAEALGDKGTDGSELTILLAHDPRHFEAYTGWGADLTLSGHVHGGIMRLPFVGGVFSPSFRLFPKYDAGIFKKDSKYMAVSRGLGSHHIKFRWFNPPELMVIDINHKR